MAEPTPAAEIKGSQKTRDGYMFSDILYLWVGTTGDTFPSVGQTPAGGTPAADDYVLYQVDKDTDTLPGLVFAQGHARKANPYTS